MARRRGRTYERRRNKQEEQELTKDKLMPTSTRRANQTWYRWPPPTATALILLLSIVLQLSVQIAAGFVQLSPSPPSKLAIPILQDFYVGIVQTVFRNGRSITQDRDTTIFQTTWQQAMRRWFGR